MKEMAKDNANERLSWGAGMSFYLLEGRELIQAAIDAAAAAPPPAARRVLEVLGTYLEYCTKESRISPAEQAAYAAQAGELLKQKQKEEHHVHQ